MGWGRAGDVGLARIMDATHLATGLAPCGTFAYAAPEMLMGTRCSEKVRRLVKMLRLRRMLVSLQRHEHSNGHAWEQCAATLSIDLQSTFHSMFLRWRCDAMQVDIYSFGVVLWVSSSCIAPCLVHRLQTCSLCHTAGDNLPASLFGTGCRRQMQKHCCI